MATSMWDAVVGQDRAVEMLQRAATRPVHAYLLVGPRGSGIEIAARCFAAMLIGADGDDRVLRGRHPDVVEFRPVETLYSVEPAGVARTRRADLRVRPRRARRDPARGPREPDRVRAQVRRAARGGPPQPRVVEHP